MELVSFSQSSGVREISSYLLFGVTKILLSVGSFKWFKF